MTDIGNAQRDYILRVAADEIDFMEKAFLLQDYPHVVKVFEHPIGRFVLRHVQNFCWTAERIAQRLLDLADWRRSRGPAASAQITPAHFAKDKIRPKVWIDITNTYRSGFSGGMERAAGKLAKAATETGLALPVFMQDGDLYEYAGQSGRGEKINFASDIVYVIADSFWQQTDEYRDMCATARIQGAKVVLCIHDVIPLYYPSFNRSAFVHNFAGAFADIIELCDACIASSKYTCDQVSAAIKRMHLRIGRPVPLTHFHLGADGHVGADLGNVRDAVRDLFARRYVFLSVGTLEPRKGYAVTLDAFDELWRRGIDSIFVIFGHHGWIAKSLEQRIIEHPRFGDTLHWFDDASDAELTFAYRHAYCLVQASITEGFGLPIVEASLEMTPVIATDNAIFRELAGDEITYFRSCDGADLAEKIAAAIALRPPAGRLYPQKWDQSLTQMVSRISDVLARERQAA